VCNSRELVEDRAAQAELGKCRVAMIGLPDDTGVVMNNGRAGARRGPHAFRAALARYGVASPMDEPGEHPAYPRVFDAGDIVIGQSLEETHARVTEATLSLLEQGMFPIAIGGGHDLTFPFVRGVSRVFGQMKGLYLDAHLDVRAEAGSGMPFRALLDDGLVSAVSIWGIDPLVNTTEHAAWFGANGGTVLGREVGPGPVPGEGDQPSFVSLDLDVLDSAAAPGVSAINPCGATAREIGAWVDALSRDRSVRCFDIMELNPDHDVDGRTARIAAHMFLRFLRGMAERLHEERTGA
jgi:formimidoylglutamase